MNVVLGVDGGGTRTRASIVTAGKVIAYAENGSIKRLRVGEEAAEANLRELLKDVYAQAGIKRVFAASVGVASCSLPGTVGVDHRRSQGFWRQALRSRRRRSHRPRCGISGWPRHSADCRNWLQHHRPCPDGSRESAGGYSSRLGDEGSGYWIGLNAVRRALHAFDREQPTRILDKVGEIWGTSSIDDLVNLGDGTPGPDFAALAPAINELAEAGDPVALAVLKRAAADLVEFVLLVRGKLRRNHHIQGEVPVAWTGGVVEKMDIVREAFFAGLKAAAPDMPVGSEGVVSLDGALWRAKRLADSVK